MASVSNGHINENGTRTDVPPLIAEPLILATDVLKPSKEVCAIGGHRRGSAVRTLNDSNSKQRPNDWIDWFGSTTSSTYEKRELCSSAACRPNEFACIFTNVNSIMQHVSWVQRCPSC